MQKIILLVLLFSTTTVIAQQDLKAVKYAAAITESGMKDKLSILASAEMEGRETATPGQKRAAAYIENEFKKLGLQPGSGTGYQQFYPVYKDSIATKTLSVNGSSFEWDKDFSVSLRGLANGEFVHQSVVFVGFGIVDSINKINDLEGLDLKDKVAVILEGSPAGYTAPPVSGRRAMSASSTNAKIANARKAGAAAVLVVTNDFPKKVASITKSEMYLKANPTGSLTVSISPQLASALLNNGKNLSFEELKVIKKGIYAAALKIKIDKTVETLESSNVIGVLPGTDKKDEYIFITGHYDHLGKRGDVIYYGADDDGSGTVGVMQMAEAFMSAAKSGVQPRRTIVFMTVSGEEKGLWGSDYYSEHPLFSLEKTSVDLNIDMIGRVDTERKLADTLNYIYVIGHDKLSSELPVINESVNKLYTNLTLDYKYDDPKDLNQIYYRSDHYNFAKKGVPVLFFYDGMLQSDYHKPTDTVDKINFELMAKRAKLVFHTAWVMANKDSMLKRDTPLNMPSSR
jgi:hypothetical protein